MSLELAGLKARFVRMAFEEFIMNHYTAKSSRSDVHHDWLTYADKCFASSSCSEYQSHLFSELNVSHFYHKHVKDSNKKRKLKKTIAEFKSLIDSLLGALFDNPNNFKDITFDNHKTIGEWYRNMQCRLISPHQHKKSLSLKHQRINPRTSSKVRCSFPSMFATHLYTVYRECTCCMRNDWLGLHAEVPFVCPLCAYVLVAVQIVYVSLLSRASRRKSRLPPTRSASPSANNARLRKNRVAFFQSTSRPASFC